MHKTIFVTGGLGFVGLNLIQKILTETSHTVSLLVRSVEDPRLVFLKTSHDRVHFVVSDLLNLTQHRTELTKVTDVIHLAGDLGKVSGDSYLPSIQTNVIGTATLMETIASLNLQHCVLLSSAAVYGEQSTPKAINETYALKPINIYGAGKLAAEQLAYAYYRTKKVPVTILRPFKIYGPHQKPPMLIPIFIQKILKGETITLNNGGQQTRDFVHVDDVSNAILRVIESPKVVGEIFNVATGKTKSVREVAELIKETLQADTSIDVKPALAPESNFSRGSSKKIKTVLCWKPTYSFEKGLLQTIRWYQKNHSFLTT